MKNRILIMIIIVMLISFVGCNYEKAEDTNSVLTPTTEVVSVTKIPATITTTEQIVSTTKHQTTKVESTTTNKITSTTKHYPTTSTTKKPITTSKTETTIENPTKLISTTKEETELKCHKNNHIGYCGNMNKWFKSKNELKNHVDSIMQYWNDEESNGNITYDEYVKLCPYGYEAWTCSNCRMWTGNFKYITD